MPSNAPFHEGGFPSAQVEGRPGSAWAASVHDVFEFYTLSVSRSIGSSSIIRAACSRCFL
jgi:hypothetical protein